MTTGTQTLDRAMAILAVFNSAAEPMGVQEVARRLDLRPTTAHRLLQALVRHGFVQQHPVNRTYWLGWTLVSYANTLIHNTELASAATDLVRGLRDRTEETAAVLVRVGHDRVCVMEFESPHDLRRTMGVGRRLPLHSGASGRAIMAFLPVDELDQLLTASPPVPTANYTVLALPRIHALLREAQQSGVAWSQPEEGAFAGVTALATPFFMHNGAVGGALAISGPTGRWTPDAMSAHIGCLLQVGEELSRRLGFQDQMPSQSAPRQFENVTG